MIIVVVVVATITIMIVGIFDLDPIGAYWDVRLLRVWISEGLTQADS